MAELDAKEVTMTDPDADRRDRIRRSREAAQRSGRPPAFTDDDLGWLLRDVDAGQEGWGTKLGRLVHEQLTYSEASKERMLAMSQTALTARQRLWRARDELRLAERDLERAQVAASQAERDWQESRKLLEEVWASFRDEVTAKPTGEEDAR